MPKKVPEKNVFLKLNKGKDMNSRGQGGHPFQTEVVSVFPAGRKKKLLVGRRKRLTMHSLSLEAQILRAMGKQENKTFENSCWTED